MSSSPRVRQPLTAAVVLTVTALLSAPAAAEEQQSFGLIPTGEQIWLVPDEVHTIDVVAIGAPGGSGMNNGGRGGRGARVAGRVAVTPGTPLYVTVGHPGVLGGSSMGGSVFGGGGYAGPYGASGGGASDVRTISHDRWTTSLASRLLVAAGGGGGGGGGQAFAGGGAGGDAESAGGDGIPAPAGMGAAAAGTRGGAATATAGGSGGTGGSGGAYPGQPGTAGALGVGGTTWATGSGGGGGGGGGLYGGGAAGGAAAETDQRAPVDPGGGGGGGSNLVPPGGSATLDDGGWPGVTIAWEYDPGAVLQPPVLLAPDRVLLLGATTIFRGAVTATFEYGLDQSYGARVAVPALQGGGPATAELTGLRPATTYHYRLVATTPGGRTAASADATFTTASGPGSDPGPGTSGPRPGPGADPDEPGRTAAARLTVAVPAHSLRRAQRGVVRVQLRNRGNAAAQGLRLTLRLPAGLAPAHGRGDRVSTALAPLAAGRSRTVAVSLRALAKAPRGARTLRVAVTGRGGVKAAARGRLTIR